MKKPTISSFLVIVFIIILFILSFISFKNLETWLSTEEHQELKEEVSFLTTENDSLKLLIAKQDSIINTDSEKEVGK